jgi:hypothetical protein
MLRQTIVGHHSLSSIDDGPWLDVYGHDSVLAPWSDGSAPPEGSRDNAASSHSPTKPLEDGPAILGLGFDLPRAVP